MAAQRALITGVTGQDGSYLAEHLQQHGFEVHGIVRTTTSDLSLSRVGHLIDRDSPQLHLHVADLGDEGSMIRIIDRVRPCHVYNLAAQSHVKASFSQPIHTGDITGLGAARLLEAIRNVDPAIRYYQASSSEMFGSSAPPQSESTPFHPRSPYAVAKVYAYWSTVNYREAYGIHASNGILFNHESPRRGKEFVTRKITNAVARIAAGQQKVLRLGNLDARRDWGHARDYVRAMHLMLEHPGPTDLVIGTGLAHSVRDFVEVAFSCVGLDWEKFVDTDPALFRPAEVDFLCADASRARSILGWHPETDFVELIEEMVRHDCHEYGR